MSDETDYLTFKKMKAEGHTGTELVCYFGSATAARLALRYQADEAAARVFREPVEIVCSVCHRKHCHGHAQESGAGR